MLIEHSDYRHYLKSELASRINVNPSYSLRAFASQLGISPSMLSLVLAGKKTLSRKLRQLIATKLKLNPKETEYFDLLVELDSTESPEQKGYLQDRLNSMAGTSKTNLEAEVFRAISDWHHYAILMLSEIENFQMTPLNISKRLGIDLFSSETALHRLIQLNLLKKVNGTKEIYRRVKGNLNFDSLEANHALQKYHLQILAKAQESVTTQKYPERYLASEVVAISSDHLEEARSLSEEFLSKIIRLAAKSKGKNRVYNIGVQMFSLDKQSGAENEK